MNNRIDDAQLDDLLRRTLKAERPHDPIAGLIERSMTIAASRAKRHSQHGRIVVRRRVLSAIVTILAVLSIAVILMAGHQSFAGIFGNYLNSDQAQSSFYSTSNGDTDSYLSFALFGGAVALVGIFAALLRTSFSSVPSGLFQPAIGFHNCD